MAVSAIAFVGVLASCSAGTQAASDNPSADVSVNVPPAADISSPTESPNTGSPTVTPPSTTPPVTTPAPTKTTTQPPKPVAQVSPGVPCAITTGACVDLSAHKAWLLKDGEVIYGPVPALPGRKSNPTPVGNFHVLYKEKMHYSKQFNNAPMPNSVFFYPGDAFHTGSLSTYSHGCIHLSSAASLKF